MSGNHPRPPAAAIESRSAGGDLPARLCRACQPLLPTRLLSRLAHGVAQSRWAPLKRFLISWFMRRYNVELADAEHPQPGDYPSFNAFFMRTLKDGARPLEGDARCFLSPVDGTISQRADIYRGRMIQAKGRDYAAAELLASPERAERLAGGSFCTLYLAPRDYHGVHMPCDAKLVSWSYVPGRLLSVNPAMADRVPRLFARNERVIAHFESAFGPLEIVMVGALLVGSIETMWAGVVTPPHTRRGGPQHYGFKKPLRYDRGGVMGRFKMGSTVILLAPPQTLQWKPSTVCGQVVRMGRTLAVIQASTRAA
ncbi:MAG TPA: archaetidylserine decarboxylase [Nevskiaceae bacterium]